LSLIFSPEITFKDVAPGTCNVMHSMGFGEEIDLAEEALARVSGIGTLLQVSSIQE
jgi:hypothetical protein